MVSEERKKNEQRKEISLVCLWKVGTGRMTLDGCSICSDVKPGQRVKRLKARHEGSGKI